MKLRFSIRAKVALFFGSLFLAAGIILEISAIRISRSAIRSKIEAHLSDNALYIAELLDMQGDGFFAFFRGLSRHPVLQDASVSFTQKAQILTKELSFPC